jgi:predicted dienelactone hydrolase
LKYVSTNAFPAAAAADGPFPVLIFSHGRGGFRQHNTMQVEELVSHGYVVATIDHPYAASGVVFPGGRLAPFDPRMFDPAHPGHPAFLDSIIPFLAQDAVFTLNQLAVLNRADPKGVLIGRLDLQRAGMFGVSLGGATTAEACRADQRFRACLMMDVFMPDDVVEAGLKQPAMWISRDTASMRLEGWAQRDIDETQNTMRAVFETLPGDGYLVLVPGMFHPNFSDFPLFSPATRWLHLAGPIDPRQGLGIIGAFTVAFFDRELKAQQVGLLDRPTERFPEVLFEARRP